MKIILLILLHLLTFVGYLEALMWTFEQDSAKVLGDAMSQGMKNALGTLIIYR